MNKAVNMLAHGTKWSVWCPGVLLSCVWWWLSWVSAETHSVHTYIRTIGGVNTGVNRLGFHADP